MSAKPLHSLLAQDSESTISILTDLYGKYHVFLVMVKCPRVGHVVGTNMARNISRSLMMKMTSKGT